MGGAPDYRQKGIGEQLINEFTDYLTHLGVQKIHTLVDWNDTKTDPILECQHVPPLPGHEPGTHPLIRSRRGSFSVVECLQPAVNLREIAHAGVCVEGFNP